jgi:hypothetical protein
MVLVVCLSPSRTGIDPRSIRVRFAVNKVATEEVYVRLFRVSVIAPYSYFIHLPLTMYKPTNCQRRQTKHFSLSLRRRVTE